MKLHHTLVPFRCAIASGYLPAPLVLVSLSHRAVKFDGPKRLRRGNCSTFGPRLGEVFGPGLITGINSEPGRRGEKFVVLNSIFGWFSNDLAIDLGTANTLIYVKGEGIVCNEPSVVAVQKDSRGARRVLAIGSEAKKMLGRTPGSIVAIRPLKDAGIAALEITETMRRYFIRKTHNRRFLVRPRIVICVPFGITAGGKRAVRESAESAGAQEGFLVEEPMAAPNGA